MAADSVLASKNLVVVIAGPTAAGKSDVASKICHREKGIVVSADSVQAYKGVLIGANKPSLEERNETPHILVDVADHTQNYNAAEWRADCMSAIAALLVDPSGKTILDGTESPALDSVKDGRATKGYAPDEKLLPVVCGGTMMYLQWLVHGTPDAMRPSQSAVASADATITNFKEKNDFHGAVKHVSSFGKIFSDRVDGFCGEDWYRLRRTLEIALTVEDEEDKDSMIEKLYTGVRQGSLASFGYDVRCFFLCPDDRMAHTKVIDQRCEQMIVKGLLEETTELSLSRRLPDMAARAIGYRQTLDYLRAADSTSEEDAFNSYIDDFTTATRRYAKKQMSWFRKDKDFMFIPVSLSLEKDKRVDTAAAMIQKYCHMPRKEFENQLFAKDGISAMSKSKNEDQGKKMKFYKSERHILKTRTKDFDKCFSQAVACRERMQQKKKRRIEENS